MRVLLVEDNADSALPLRMLLQLEGFDVEHALDGRAALEAAKRNPPAIVLCDLTLPDMLGTEVIAAIGPGPRCICVTGRSRSDVLAECLESGFHEILQKPIDLDELLRSLRVDRK